MKSFESNYSTTQTKLVTAPRVVLVTGSTSGIGKNILEAFAKNNDNVVVHGLGPDAREVAKEIEDTFQVKTLASKANCENPSQLVELINDIEKTFGGIDVIVNNAGIQHVSAFEEFPLEKWNQILAVNLTAAFVLSQAAWPLMKKSRFGRIINIASVHGIRASEFKSAYIAAKHGLLGLTKALALEGALHGITVNAICPGYVNTPLVAQQIEAQAMEHKLPLDQVVNDVILKKHAIKEFIDPRAVTDLVMYLAQGSAAQVTGASFILDAGWSAQ